MTALLTLISLTSLSAIALALFYALTLTVEHVERTRRFADAEALRIAVLSGAIRSDRPAVPPMPVRTLITV